MVRRVLRGLVALPRQLGEVWRSIVHGSPAVLEDHVPSSDQAPTPRRALLGLPISLVETLAALVIVFAVTRALYYPFWAAQASHAALDRSWGGPSAIGATVAHWVVAAMTVVVAYAVLVAAHRLAGRASTRIDTG